MRGASSSISRNKLTPLLGAYSTVEMLTTFDGPALIDPKASYWSKIASFCLK